jgi:hypothetical protein
MRRLFRPSVAGAAGFKQLTMFKVSVDDLKNAEGRRPELNEIPGSAVVPTASRAMR